jgi:hypothetical protein
MHFANDNAGYSISSRAPESRPGRPIFARLSISRKLISVTNFHNLTSRGNRIVLSYPSIDTVQVTLGRLADENPHTP